MRSASSARQACAAVRIQASSEVVAGDCPLSRSTRSSIAATARREPASATSLPSAGSPRLAEETGVGLDEVAVGAGMFEFPATNGDWDISALGPAAFKSPAAFKAARQRTGGWEGRVGNRSDDTAYTK